ncbi:hypothetical protein [Mucilaginibacter pedocola]|uniref:Uncharacterized protein n=1 Tax=Mucilaginibacter pedocola TaxID=1792845 RepID=A0A1S9PAW9_9SPHI|nr:hypothetical protein [Mucilaginibacter pedocola]OOQ58124.1 hypothetical protein BC343_10765 [Mucilaginibacter pedocola]
MPSPHEAAWENLEQTLNAGLTLRQAWDLVIDFHSGTSPADYWDKVRALNVDADQPALASWMAQIISDSPLPENIIAIWLGITKFWDEEEEKEYYAVYLAGADSYDADDAEWACDAAYRPANKYIIPDIPNDVDELIKTDEENYSFLDWILPLAYTALAFNDIIKTRLDKSGFLKNQTSLPVTVGFDDGDFISIQPLSK